MRALVTGSDGFVGTHLVRELRVRGAEVVRGGHRGLPTAGDAIDVHLDLQRFDTLRDAVREARPDVVFHLAGQAFAPAAAADPLATYDVNALGTARLVRAIEELGDPAPRLVFASSGEVYGDVDPSLYPVREDVALRPTTVYAASKVAAEAFVLAAARARHVSAIVTRAFNHIGPGQSDRFVVARFARRLAEIANGGPPLFPVGNLTPARDFLDVRDVVRAYAELGARGISGEIYNVCSGVATPIVDILRRLVTLARVGVEIREDPALVRAGEVPVIFGDARRLREATGWAPEFSLARSLRDVYDDARARVEAA